MSPSSDIVGKFDEALEYFRKRVPMPAGRFYTLETQAREKAFTVSGTAQADVIQDVLDSIERALEEGQSLKDWKKEIGYALQHAWAGTVADPGWRLETIYRTNVQTAFSHGRVRQMREPEVVAVRPYWLYDATRDSRTTHECRELDGTLLPANDPRWKGKIPPRRFNCRSHLQTLRRSQAERRGGIKLPPDDIGPPENGFGEGPSDDPNVQVEPFKPVRKYDPTLAAIKERKDAEAPKPPREKPEHTPEHWVGEYQRNGYPEDAARAIAYGRAAEERGLDRPLKQIRETLKRLQDNGVNTGVSLVLDRDPETLREALSNFADPYRDPDVIRSLAAIAEHADTVDRRVVPPDIPGRPRKSGELFDDRRNWFDRAVAFYTQLGSKKLSHPDKAAGYQVVWGVARGYHNAAKKKIALSDSATVLVHEWAHALEHLNPEALRRSSQFLDARTKGEPIRRLGGGYGKKEKTQEDKLADPYVGKHYFVGDRRVATELSSMGLEKVAVGEGWWLYAKDPDHFHFCLGQLAG